VVNIKISVLWVVTANVWLICTSISVLWDVTVHIWLICTNISSKVFGIQSQDCSLNIGVIF
jgi:hypothetical protein